MVLGTAATAGTFVLNEYTATPGTAAATTAAKYFITETTELVITSTIVGLTRANIGWDPIIVNGNTTTPLDGLKADIEIGELVPDNVTTFIADAADYTENPLTTAVGTTPHTVAQYVVALQRPITPREAGQARVTITGIESIDDKPVGLSLAHNGYVGFKVETKATAANAAAISVTFDSPLTNPYKGAGNDLDPPEITELVLTGVPAGGPTPSLGTPTSGAFIAGTGSTYTLDLTGGSAMTGATAVPLSMTFGRRTTLPTTPDGAGYANYFIDPRAVSFNLEYYVTP